MTQVFKIDLKHQLKSISNGIWIILIVSLVMLYFWIIEDINPIQNNLLILFAIITLLYFLPALILHPLYYYINRKTKLKYNSEEKELILIDGDKSFQFKESDVEEIERVYFTDFKLPRRQRNFMTPTWRNYGLIRIMVKSKQEFILTSLMIDVVNPPLKPTVNKFRLIPFPPRSLKNRERDIIESENARKKKIDFFKASFSNKTKSELNKKLNDNDLVDEAKIAVREIINEKNTTANNV